MNIIDKNTFLSKEKLKKEYVKLDNSGIFIREMTGKDVQILSDGKYGKIEYLAAIIALTACDEEGTLFFSLDEVSVICESNSLDTLTKLSDVAIRLSRIGKAAVDEAKDKLKNA